jgi:MFS family permease
VIFFLTLWFPARYRARIMGWFMFAVPISSVIGAPLSGLILGMNGLWGLHGWQWMFVLEAIPSLLLAVAVLFYLTDRPSEARWLEPDERAWLQNRLETERSARGPSAHAGWLEAMLNPRVLAFGLVYLGIVTPLYGLGFFLPQIVEGFGVSTVAAGFITAVPYAVGAVGMVLWSHRSDRTRERVWHMVVPCAAIIAGLAGAAFATDPALKMALICLAGFGLFASLPVFWTLPTAALNGAAAAAGIAAVNSIGNLGGYFGPQVFGLLKDRTGSELVGLLCLAALPALSAGLVFALGRGMRQEASGPLEPEPQRDVGLASRDS